MNWWATFAPRFMFCWRGRLPVLIANANVANLMLARASARKESRPQCARRERVESFASLTESLLLAALGGGLDCHCEMGPTRWWRRARKYSRISTTELDAQSRIHASSFLRPESFSPCPAWQAFTSIQYCFEIWRAGAAV